MALKRIEIDRDREKDKERGEEKGQMERKRECLHLGPPSRPLAVHSPNYS